MNKESKVFNFGEKTQEKYKTKEGLKDLDVWQSPKYLSSKDKAIELIESEKYGLDTGDFWILKNQGGAKLVYTGLIISHNGCLKINDKLDDKLKFKPSCVNFVKDDGDKIKVMSYISDEQGVYEFGEISPNNCKNDYPYAMVLKRLMDRVILKNSKVGFFGIYSEAESEDIKESHETDNSKQKTDKEKLSSVAEFAGKEMADLVDGKKKEDEIKKTRAKNFADSLFEEMNACGSASEIEGLWEGKQDLINRLKADYKSIYNDLVKSYEALKALQL